MTDIDKAMKAQEWLMEFYRQYLPLDACLALVRFVDNSEPPALQPRTLEWEAVWSESGMKQVAVLIRDGTVTPPPGFASYSGQGLAFLGERHATTVAAGDILLLLYQSGSGKTENAKEIGDHNSRFWMTWEAAERDLNLRPGALQEAFK